MWKTLLLPVILAAAQPAFASGPPSNEAILYFEAGTTRMLPAARDSLRIYIDRHRRFYADGLGEAILCSGLEDGTTQARWLSERRARLVRKLLARGGVGPIRNPGTLPWAWRNGQAGGRAADRTRARGATDGPAMS